MKSGFPFLLMIALLLCSCQYLTKENNPAREPVSVKTHQFTQRIAADSLTKDTINPNTITKKVFSEESIAPDSIPVIPIHHASFVMKLSNQIVYVDPTGDTAVYKNIPPPDLVLITHNHPDHQDPDLLEKLVRDTTPIFGPLTVKKDMPADLEKQTQMMKNGDRKSWKGIKVKAIPAYNSTPGRLKFHPKWRGNGYVLEAEGKRIYISGDTEDIPAMRQLQDIDVAFVCMNLPYTMTVNQAVDGVLAFHPKKVYPYHYRGKGKFSNIKRFRREVEEQDPDIDVQLLEWYPKEGK